MRFSPSFCVCAAALVTLGVGQAVLPTAHAQNAGTMPALPADYQVSVQNLDARHTPRGLEVTGQIVNTGRQTLTYTSVMLVFTHTAGPDTRENAYLTAGPVRPGQTAGFRAALPEPPAFAGISLSLREAGKPVVVKSGNAQTDRRLKTVL